LISGGHTNALQNQTKAKNVIACAIIVTVKFMSFPCGKKS